MADDIYRRQIAPQDATRTLPFARPETFGAGAAAAVGNAAERVSRTLIRETAQETALERDKQASAAALQFARIQEEATEALMELQEQAEIGGDGYTRQVEAWLQDKEAQFLDSIGDDRVRQAMAERWARWRVGTVQSAQGWERGQGIAFTVGNYGEIAKLRANQAERGTAEDFEHLRAEQRADAEMLIEAGVPAATAQKLLRGAIEEMSISFLEGRPFEERKALIDSPAFDFLDPSMKRRIRDGAKTEEKAWLLEQEARARAAQAEIADEIDAVLDDLGDGLPVDDEVLEQAQARASELGLADKEKELFDARVINQANREFENVGAVAIDAEVKRLNTKIARAGTKATRADIVRRDHLSELRETRKAMIEADPAEFASRIGIEWQPLDGSDPAALRESVAARRKAARATSEVAGVPVQLLTEDEADAFAANMGTPEGVMGLLSTAAAFGPDAARVVRQVAPDRPMLQHLTGLNGTYRGYVLEGAALVEGKAFKMPSDFDAMLGEELGAALRGYAPNVQAGIRETARNLYAYFSSKSGDDGSEVNKQRLRIALNRALGTGGGAPERVGEYDGRRFILPVGMDESEFRRRVRNIRKLDGVFYGDGETPIPPRRLRFDFYPVHIGGTRYWWRGKNGNWAVDKDSRKAVIDIADYLPGIDPAPPAAEMSDTVR